jgi:diguanylate cyclase (GGDEF)-like protein/PAS domain S-box-containing protein
MKNKRSDLRLILEEKYRRLERKHLRMFSNIQDIYYETDLEGLILELSPSIESCLGWKREMWLGRPMRHLFVDGIQWDDLIDTVIDKRLLRDHEVILKNCTDSSVPCSMNVRLISSDDEPYERLMGLIRDISGRKRMEFELLESKKRYELLSITDGLTNLFNLRHFYDQLSSEMERSRRYGHPLSLILLDVDDFKKFNDTFGHKEGDSVLVKIADVVRSCLRRTDTAYRYGGEEFVVILPETKQDRGLVIAERIRATFKKHIFYPGEEKAIQKTVSLGVTQLSVEEDSSSFIKRADKNMYKAKSLGKDQTFCL